MEAYYWSQFGFLAVGRQPLPWDYFRVARLNVVAGETDASRAMLLTSCRKVELLTALFYFL
jgi:hypothetical protein